MKDKGRATIYAMGGFYVLYLAYSMFQSRAESAGNEYTLIMIFIGIFLIAGIAMLVLAGNILWITTKKEAEQRKNSVETEADTFENENETNTNEINANEINANEINANEINTNETSTGVVEEMIENES